MSLLLDALKKAAEQKAAKSKEASSEVSASDETVVDSGADDTSVLAGSSPAQPIPPPPRDETEVDHTEMNTRMDRDREASPRDDETSLDPNDKTVLESPVLSEQMQTGEDETIIFAEEDVSEFLGEAQYVNREKSATEDETELTQQADVINVVPVEDQTSVDQTSVDQASIDVKPLDDDTELTRHRAEADQTDHSPAAETKAPGSDETEQNYSPAPADQTDVSRTFTGDSEDTSISQISDMSLLLSDKEDTNLTSRTSMTDPKTPGAHAGIPSGEDDDELGLVDITRVQPPPDENEAEAEPTATPTESSATTGVALEALTSEATATRTDSTSTRTYAPDNYDRTLMRLPSDDASKLFAGMKSDSDVVMTPDYAKKVFKSKSSAQQMQHYKFYGGIAIAILLAIGIYGLFEMQEESINIDNSLRPLKRDPLPGIIKPAEEESGSLFASNEINAQTLEIIENAKNIDQTTLVETKVEESAVVDDEPIVETEEVTETAPSQVASVDSTVVEKAPAKVAIADKPAVANTAQNSGSTLEIISSARIAEKNIWLREAYDAYKAGNDELAMTKYDQVLKVDPDNRNALLARAAINVQNNNASDAIRDYQKILLANPKDTLAMTSLITVANYSPQDTETQLKLMIRDQPDSPFLNFALANAYGAQNRWQEAQGHYFTALEQNPGDPNYAYNLAVSMEHISKPKVAMAYYQRALDNFGNGLATFNRDVVNQRLEMLAKQ